MTAAGVRTAIYPAMRAIEQAQTLSGIRPTRLFGVLWPLWRVDVEAELYEPEAYEMLDRFLTRGVAAELSTVDELAGFFGLEPALVTRVLDFLLLIRHLDNASGRYVLTDLGHRSLADGRRYVYRTSRQYLLFDAATMQPLTRDHYAGQIALLDQPSMPRQGIAFHPLYFPAEFRPDVVQHLATRPDRTDFNLPVGFTNPRVVGVREVYLPAYLVKTESPRTPYLAYTKVAGDRDTFIEARCGERSVVAALARAEPEQDLRPLWERWLLDHGLPATALSPLPAGGWRATLPHSAFGSEAKFGLHRLGSYAVHRTYFLQLWSTDTALRRRAVLTRVGQMRRLSSRAEVREQLAAVAAQLELETPGLDALAGYDVDTATWLAALPDA